MKSTWLLSLLQKPLLVCGFLCGGTLLWAADVPAAPAWGADAVPDLYAPNLAGPGSFATSAGGAPASAVNPAQGGHAQRIVFDMGYLGLAGFGDEQKYGHAAELGALFPTRYGVFGGSMRFINSPFDESFPIKTTFSGNLNAAKEIYPGMSLGAGLNFGFIDEWSLSADLGFRYNTGKLGPFANFTWAVVLGNMGKSWTPSWFTPLGGVSFDVVRVEGRDGKRDPFVLNASVDMGIPSAVYFPQTSAVFKLGLRAEIAEIVRISLAWPGASGINVRELRDGGEFPFIPSIGLGVNLVLPSGGKRIAGGRLPNDGDLAIDMAYKPLYEQVAALGIGATWTAGIADTQPPVTVLDYSETAYFSPNNDGKADYLEFPVAITDERYVDSWSWEIRDSDGNIVRTYRNKELRHETRGMRNLFSRLAAVKTQVEVPPALRWDGIGDSGTLAPDGRYFFTVTAADDSGNTGTTRSFEAVLKNAPPEISLAPIDDAQRVFSPGGGGSKNTITFTPQGTEEDGWESGVYNSFGERIRAFDTESGRPGPREWDGKDDAGLVVPDGVYTFRIGTVDRAKNSAEAVMDNVIVNTIRPEVTVFIADPWFSPNNDGVKDSVIMDLAVPVAEEVTEWTMQIEDRQGVLRRTVAGNKTLGPIQNTSGIQTVAVPGNFEFDGRNDSGTVLEEGEYQAELRVSYLNGYTATAVSPRFNLRVTPPSAVVSSDFTAFSPNYGGVQSEMMIRQEASQEVLWTGEIRRANAAAGERAVRSFRFPGTLPPDLSWDGHGEAGTFAADGAYTYELFSTDQAGNTGRSNVLHFRLSTVDTPVMITTDPRAFSPNGDGVKDTVNLKPIILVKEGIVSYRLEILDGSDQTVRVFEGRGAPAETISWNGRTAENSASREGFHRALLELRYEQGNQPTATSLPFELDVTPPKAAVSAPYTVFSPNGRRGTIPFNVTTEANDQWEAAITGSGGVPARIWNWRGAAPDITWDGKDSAGNAAPDGMYQLVLKSTDAAGNSAQSLISGLTLDARIPRLIVTASTGGIAPAPNQSTDLVRFGIMNSLQEGIENWTLELKDEQGATVKRFSSGAPGPNGTVASPPASIGWNGLAENGGIREGRVIPTLTVNYLKGDQAVAVSAPVLVNVTGPELSIRYRPEYFSPDNDGVDDELFISLGAKSLSPIDSWYLEIREPVAPHLLFYRIEGKGSPSETVMWDGRSNRGELVQAATDYPVRYSATDTLGNTSSIDSTIGVDVLVIRDGNRLKIQVPSIVFRENAADFDGIPADRLENNLRVLRRIADILNKFRDYKVQVEGHANPVSRTVREEQNELRPLSEARAKTVVNKLIEYGVFRTRLSAVGMGGSTPVVRYEDHDNWWKNRRVEFILIK